MELFDFENEVEPILQVLVGRTLVISKYELLEEEERTEFLEQTRQIAQKREFELIKLQREEAARIRRDKEIERRNLQKKQRVERNKIVQQKLLSKYYVKNAFRNLQSSVFRGLNEKGYFTKKTQMKVIDVISQKFIPIANKFSVRTSINKEIFGKLQEMIYKKEISKHGILMNQVFTDRKNEKIQKEKEVEEKKLADEQFEKEKAEKKEKHRVEKFTKIVEETILKSKYDKTDISVVPLCDFDDLTQVSSGIHTVGGQLGEFIIALQGLLEGLIYKYTEVADLNNALTQDNTSEEEKEKVSELNKENQVAMEGMEGMEGGEDAAAILAEKEKQRKLKEKIYNTPLNIYPKEMTRKKILKNFKLEKFIQNVVNLFLQGLKDNESISLKYLESQRFDFAAIPEEEDKRK